MPTILRIERFRFCFYSSDYPGPPHVHVEQDDNTAKSWLNPIRLQNSHGFSRRDINKILKIVEENHKFLLRSWDEYFYHEK